MSAFSHNKFANLKFSDFRELAKNPALSCHEKVGFPDSYREGKEADIFNDMVTKLPNLLLPKKNILEIGPGCSNLPIMLAQLCEKTNSQILFVDSPEMLTHLPKAAHITEYPGAFPFAMLDDFNKWCGQVDVVIAYSVIQYVFVEGNLWDFIDRCLLLLADGGEILFGDVPNISMRKRFFSSATGIATHQQFIGRDEKPEVVFNQIESGQIDDSVVLSILARVRAQGFQGWVVPQSPSLPLANRREDILIRKP